MRYLRVKKWEQFQHYRDRLPPWIKMHRELLTDYEFCILPDESKAHLMLIWLLASQMDGQVPDDARFIADHIGAKRPINLSILVASGWLITEQSASNPLAECEQDASKVLALARSREAYKEETYKEEAEKAKTRAGARNPSSPDPKPKRLKAVARTGLPENFTVSERVQSWASDKGYLHLAERLEHFIGYVRRSGKIYVDWDEALMSAIREDWAHLNGNGTKGSGDERQKRRDDTLRGLTGGLGNEGASGFAERVVNPEDRISVRKVFGDLRS